MGCNCGRKANATVNTHAARATANPAPKPRRTVTRYRLTLPNGAIRDYVTVQEADAANRRAGGRGRITAVNL